MHIESSHSVCTDDSLKNEEVKITYESLQTDGPPRSLFAAMKIFGVSPNQMYRPQMHAKKEILDSLNLKPTTKVVSVIAKSTL